MCCAGNRPFLDVADMVAVKMVTKLVTLTAGHFGPLLTTNRIVSYVVTHEDLNSHDKVGRES